MEKEKIEMIDKTIRILNSAIGKITSLQGNPVDYLKNKIKELEQIKGKKETELTDILAITNIIITDDFEDENGKRK